MLLHSLKVAAQNMFPKLVLKFKDVKSNLRVPNNWPKAVVTILNYLYR